MSKREMPENGACRYLNPVKREELLEAVERQ